MARGFAYAYKKGQRPADEPAGNFKALNPESHSAGSSRRIHRENTPPPPMLPPWQHHLRKLPPNPTKTRGLWCN